MSCDEIVTSLGAHALGALEPAERDAVEDHLRDCPTCAAELQQLRDPVTFLDRLESADLDDLALLDASTPPPDALFDRIRQATVTADELEVRRSARRRRLRLLAAAAVIVVVGGGVALGVGLRSGGGPPSYSASAGGRQMTVTVDPQADGTELHVTVAGLPEEEHCRLIAVGTDGSRHLVGVWDATYKGSAAFTGSTSLSRPDLNRLVLLGTGRQRLVSVDL
jgi:anti-sigma factor RsiW